MDGVNESIGCVNEGQWADLKEPTHRKDTSASDDICVGMWLLYGKRFFFFFKVGNLHCM